ncbi:MAG: FAD-dependent oxidoreductase [Firmicutes bacterium]|nr:FAD-dependent oxidoreductase [Alicyclobacillaceae bacterium]MCL6496906.1 FAD-dependent oxidoreductase [Bacillota bacterium]
MAQEQAMRPIATQVVRRTAPAPVSLQVDVAVLGSGISGVAAALEAARLGRQVAIIDGLPALGGQAVHSIIGTFAGLYSNGPNAYRLTHLVADQLLYDLEQVGAVYYRRGPLTTVVMYDEVALGRWVEESVRRAGITVVLGAVLREVVRDGRRIRALRLATRYGEVEVAATGFVDASGDAALTWMAGLPCREPKDAPIYGTQMVVLEQVEESELPGAETMRQRLAEKANAYGFRRLDGFAFAYPGRGMALVNMTHIPTPLDPVGMSRQTLEGKAQADAVVRFLREEFPQAFGRARVRAYGLPGIRQTRWIVGRHQLTADEVRQGVRFPDAVARTAWPIELHDREEGYVWEPFGPDHVHYVPLASMTPPDVDNLVACGRCIDGDALALSSVRVMGPGIAMGAAAAHALDLAGTGSVHALDLDALHRRLAENLDRRD